MTEFLGCSSFGRYLENGSEAARPRVYPEESQKGRLARQEAWELNQDQAL